MGRAPCCDKANVKKGPWSPEEDAQLKEYIQKHGTGGNWIALPQKAGLKRCGKSCRLRWLNYLRPDIKHGEFSDHEDRIICSLFANIGSRWSVIASQLPGRTDNDIKNYWNTKLKKKMISFNINPSPHHHQTTLLPLLQNSTPSSSSSSASSPLSSFTDNNTSNASYCHPAPYASSFSGSDHSISFSSSARFLNSHISTCASASASSSFYQPQESLMGPIELVAASCGQMSHRVKEAEASATGYNGVDEGTKMEQMVAANNYNYDYLQNIGMENMEEGQKAMDACDGDYVNGLWEENPPLDYGIEEIMQLISSTNSCNSFLFDENMTHKRALHYY